MDHKRPIALSYTPPQPAGSTGPPPAYTLERSPSLSSSESSKSSVPTHPQPQTTPLPPPPVTEATSVPTTSKVYISRRRDAISDTFILDPAAPEIFYPDREPRLPKVAKRALKKRATPTVALASRRENIIVRLLIRGSTPLSGRSIDAESTLICADARRGNIYLDIAEKRPAIPLSVYTSSRRGSTTVILPLNFNGTVELTTKHGRTDILRGLAARARVVRERGEKELHLAIGDPAGRDFARLDSRDGIIRLGLSGLDDASA
ncbi:unnamed protein product [Peniophora sp. CBMAI 1063]|nr:unnamed protein product [Peniophora sp. CBMAI 1063]